MFKVINTKELDYLKSNGRDNKFITNVVKHMIRAETHDKFIQLYQLYRSHKLDPNKSIEKEYREITNELEDIMLVTRDVLHDYVDDAEIRDKILNDTLDELRFIDAMLDPEKNKLAFLICSCNYFAAKYVVDKIIACEHQDPYKLQSCITSFIEAAKDTDEYAMHLFAEATNEKDKEIINESMATIENYLDALSDEINEYTSNK